MRGIFDVRPVPVGDQHRTTMFEIFFDLVFVFALTRVITFMAQPPTALTLAQGLILLLLLIYSWGPYLWLGNLVRADVGPARAATLLAMAAIFVAALVLPDAWRQGPGLFDAPLTLALAYLGDQGGATRRAALGEHRGRAAALDPAVLRRAGGGGLAPAHRGRVARRCRSDRALDGRVSGGHRRFPRRLRLPPVAAAQPGPFHRTVRPGAHHRAG
ncbi:low temperature requirement protein A [Micromonospora sp. ALFpr18c]|nr:low temperature requirement protein A [Micromonospora sp. ALFpr18c]